MIPHQETFNTIITHLRNQKVQAAIGPSNHCMYRTPEGLKCAAGCLIPDELYDEKFEGQVVVTFDSTNSLTQCIHKLGHDLKLVRDLQLIHDECGISQWESEFKNIAYKYGLEYEFQIW